VKKLLCVVFALFLLAGCEQQAPDQIEWQLPLEAPADPHGSDKQAELPAWAVRIPGSAELVWLNKLTTHHYKLSLSVGSASELQGWHIQLLGLASGLRTQNGTFLNDENVHNAAAYVEISRDGKSVYRGWLYKEFPELFGIDDPEWKVWLKDIKLRPAS